MQVIRRLAVIVSLATALPLSAATTTTPATTTPATTTPATTTPATTTAPTATPAPSTSSPPLLEAEAALRAGIHKKCVELAKEALKTGSLTASGVGHAWLVRGRCHLLDGDIDRADRSYAVAARVDPDLVLPTDDIHWSRIRPEGTADATALRLVARAVVMGDDAPVVGVEVLLQDDLELGATVVVRNSDDREVVSAPVHVHDDVGTADGDDRADADLAATAGGLVLVHRFSGFPVEGLTAALLDKAGNRLRVVEVVVDDDARRALAQAGGTPQRPVVAREVGTLAYVGGGVVSVGFATAAVCGINLAFTATDAVRRPEAELPWLVGFVTGATAVVVGGALVVVERLSPMTESTAAPATAGPPQAALIDSAR